MDARCRFRKCAIALQKCFSQHSIRYLVAIIERKPVNVEWVLTDQRPAHGKSVNLRLVQVRWDRLAARWHRQSADEVHPSVCAPQRDAMFHRELYACFFLALDILVVDADNPDVLLGRQPRRRRVTDARLSSPPQVLDRFATELVGRFVGEANAPQSAKSGLV